LSSLNPAISNLLLIRKGAQLVSPLLKQTSKHLMKDSMWNCLPLILLGGTRRGAEVATKERKTGTGCPLGRWRQRCRAVIVHSAVAEQPLHRSIGQCDAMQCNY